MARPEIPPTDEDAPRSPGEARLDALLEARFAPEQRRAFAAELDAHDRARAGGEGAARAGLRPPRFRGTVPDKVRQVLAEWVPELDAFAARQGLTLRDPDRPVTVYGREAFESEVGGLPAGLKLPASSYHLDALRRRYAVRVVLPPQVETLEALFTVLRALLTRLYGDVFLREEIYALESYREDVERRDGRVTVALADQIAVLSELPHTTAELEAAVGAYARNVGINLKRQPEQARKAWLREQADDLDRGRLPAERQAIIEDAFARYVAALREAPDGGVAELVAAAEAQERQLHFLPPDEAAEYDRLRRQNPQHYLRSAKLRLEFLVSALGGLVEDFDALADPQGSYPALADERIAGSLAELERGGLARPYLVPGVRLSDELEAKRKAFPLEVHALLARRAETGGEPPSEKAFRALSKRLEGSLHQRLYNALVLMRHWMKLHGSSRFSEFTGSAGYGTLKGLVANFRFRLPLLEALFQRIGVVLDVAEQSTRDETPRGFPVDAFAQAWGRYVAHALLADYLTLQRPLKGFDQATYWGRIEAAQVEAIQAGGSGAAMAAAVYLLRRLQQAVEGGGQASGLAVMVGELRAGTPAFRFAVTQALRSKPADRDAAAWCTQLEAWAQSVEIARQRRLRNAILPGDPAP